MDDALAASIVPGLIGQYGSATAVFEMAEQQKVDLRLAYDLSDDQFGDLAQAAADEADNA